MRDDISSEMVSAGVAVPLDKPVLIDKNGNVVFSKKDSFSYPVIHDVTNPDHVAVADELSSSILQKGDGHVGSAKLLCEKGLAPRKATSNQDKHFTMLGCTAISGELAMRCAIFSGISENLLVETGVDFAKSFVSDIDNPRFFEMNFGNNTLLPGGPTCAFRGKEVPCFVR